MSAARAGGITAASLIAGAAVGSAAQSWLRVDIVPIGVSQIAACVYDSCSACLPVCMYVCMYVCICTSHLHTSAACPSCDLSDMKRPPLLTQPCVALLMGIHQSACNICVVCNSTNLGCFTDSDMKLCALQGFSSPGIFVGEFALAGLWAAAALLA